MHDGPHFDFIQHARERDSLIREIQDLADGACAILITVTPNASDCPHPHLNPSAQCETINQVTLGMENAEQLWWYLTLAADLMRTHRMRGYIRLDDDEDDHQMPPPDHPDQMPPPPPR